jgi:RNA polymerase sigma factor (sigma-70 family)
LESIQREIAALPGKMREVFQLSRDQELSHKEISNKLGISEQTVSKQISNALKILRKNLGVTAFVFFLFN